MSSSNGRGLLRTVRSRLTLWYAGLFAVFAFLLFVVEDNLLRSRLAERFDDHLLRDVREFEALYTEYGLEALADEFRREEQSGGAENAVLVFRSPNLSVLASSDLTHWPEFNPDPRELGGLGAGEARFRTLGIPGLGRKARVVEARTLDGNLLQIGASLAPDEGLLRARRKSFGAVVVGMLLFGVGLGWLLTGRAMAGVGQVTRTAARIGDTNLSARVPSANRGQEIEELVSAFNAMLGRIDRVVFELREVTDNIAHDLRSPLTRMRGLAESALTGSGSPAEFRDMAGVVVEEADRLVQTIDTMLQISEANAGVAEIPARDVDATALVRDACELYLPVAEDGGVALSFTVAEGAVIVSGDLPKLQRALANVIDNAIKYTPAGGKVLVSVGPEGGDAVVRVADTGMGISADDLVRVFDRFFRCDASRASRGNGLGLSLAEAIVRAHGGQIAVQSEPEVGSCFSLRLPIVPSSVPRST